MKTYDEIMRRALALAARGAGFVSPNPMVGAVLVKAGRIVGEGWHARYGGDHAEVAALKQAGRAARGATLIVTLEPCRHWGKTPPCTDAILEAGVRRVVYGASDVGAHAGGAKLLRRHGVEVIDGVLKEECLRQNAAFFKFAATGLPFVTAKWAMTLDGKLATRTGDSRWITSEKARAYAHRLRAEHDAVLVGLGTVRADDPRLTCRIGRCRQPRRVVLDPMAQMPLGCRLLATANESEVIVFVSPGAPARRVAALGKRGAHTIRAAAGRDGLNLRACLRALGRLGIASVLVEGGSHTLGSFFDARLVDAVCVFVAPKLIGGTRALSPVGGEGAARMALATGLCDVEVRRFGADLAIRGRVSPLSPQSSVLSP